MKQRSAVCWSNGVEYIATVAIPLFGSCLLPRHFLPVCRGFFFLRIQSVEWYSTATSIFQKALSLTAVTALISLVRHLKPQFSVPPKLGFLFSNPPEPALRVVSDWF